MWNTRPIARSLTSPSTVKEYLRRTKGAGLRWPGADTIDVPSSGECLPNWSEARLRAFEFSGRCPALAGRPGSTAARGSGVDQFVFRCSRCNRSSSTFRTERQTLMCSAGNLPRVDLLTGPAGELDRVGTEAHGPRDVHGDPVVLRVAPVAGGPLQREGRTVSRKRARRLMWLMGHPGGRSDAAVESDPSRAPRAPGVPVSAARHRVRAGRPSVELRHHLLSTSLGIRPFDADPELAQAGTSWPGSCRSRWTNSSAETCSNQRAYPRPEIFNTDQDVQFTSDAFTSLLRDDLDNIHAFEIV